VDRTTQPQLLTARDVARLLNVHPGSVYRWAEQGVLPAVKVGRVVRFHPEEVRKLLERSSTHGMDPHARRDSLRVLAGRRS
jgi:excisionase family DNA binding protein